MSAAGNWCSVALTSRALRVTSNVVLMMALAALLLFYSVPPKYALVMAVVMWGMIQIFSRERYAMLQILLSLVFITLCVEVALHFNLVPNPTYYRAHERLLRADRSAYYPHRDLTIHMPFGDLFAISRGAYPAIREPRRVHFVTDSLGFRNWKDYSGEPYVLVGDSFVVGNGTDQDDNLTGVLAREFSIKTYNASFPSNAQTYVANALSLQERIGDKFHVILFLFEGNDFPCPAPTKEVEQAIAVEKATLSSSDRPNRNPQSVKWRLLGEYKRALQLSYRMVRWLLTRARDTEIYRFSFGLSRRAMQSFSAATDASWENPVAVYTIYGKQIGFLRSYINETSRMAPCDWSQIREDVRQIKDRIALIVFIPTKYRVYQPAIDPGVTLPSEQLVFTRDLAAKLGVPMIDITPALREAAVRAGARGEFVYWRDDTHWNPVGINIAASEIANALNRSP